MAIQLQALNALTYIGAPARAALPQIRRAAEDNQSNVRTAGRYLAAVLDGTYAPGFASFDLDHMRQTGA
jgi:hypothetical protein